MKCWYCFSFHKPLSHPTALTAMNEWDFVLRCIREPQSKKNQIVSIWALTKQQFDCHKPFGQEFRLPSPLWAMPRSADWHSFSYRVCYPKPLFYNCTAMHHNSSALRLHQQMFNMQMPMQTGLVWGWLRVIDIGTWNVKRHILNLKYVTFIGSHTPLQANDKATLIRRHCATCGIQCRCPPPRSPCVNIVP